MEYFQFFHNTNNKNQLLKSGQFRKPIFDYIKYIEDLMDMLYKDDNGVFIPNTYNLQMTQPPYMGVGVYCFDNYEDALKYDSKGNVVEVQYKKPFDFLNLEDPKEKLKILLALESGESKIKKLFYQKDGLEEALLLLELVKLTFMQDFSKNEPMVGVMLFILYEHIKIKKHDVVSKKFMNMIDCEYKVYYILQNYTRKKIAIVDVKEC